LTVADAAGRRRARPLLSGSFGVDAGGAGAWGSV